MGGGLTKGAWQLAILGLLCSEGSFAAPADPLFWMPTTLLNFFLILLKLEILIIMLTNGIRATPKTSQKRKQYKILLRTQMENIKTNECY
jgi:hypothetical protein